MKNILTLFLLFIFAISNAQVRMRTDNKKVLDEFRSTETVFILSAAYDTKTYEEILAQSWKVTPFKVVMLKDFTPADYLDGKHSFAMLDANSVTTKYATYLHSFIAFFTFDMKDKLKEIEKLKKKSAKNKEDYDIMREHRIVIGDIFMYKNEDFISKGSIQNAGDVMFQENLFHNYSPGFLKNYFQKMSSLLETGTAYGMYGGNCTPEVKNLKKDVLYVPEYVALKFNAMSMKESDRDKEEKEDLFKSYKYKYEYINNDALSAKILAGEEVYYLRYLMENAQKYIQVVNSKTGEIVYTNYHPIGYELKAKHIEELKKAIDTGKV